MSLFQESFVLTSDYFYFFVPQVSSTLAELYAGLKSFLFHLDWLRRKQEQSDADFSKTEKIAHHIKVISLKVLREVRATLW